LSSGDLGNVNALDRDRPRAALRHLAAADEIAHHIRDFVDGLGQDERELLPA
jgi:hypothetical protein